MTLKEVGIGEEKLEEMAMRSANNGLDEAYIKLDKNAVLEIFKKCL